MCRNIAIGGENVMNPLLNKLKTKISDKIVISYFIVLFLPIIFSVVAYSNVLSALTQKIEDTNFHILNNYASYVDTLVNRIIAEIPRVFTHDEIMQIEKLSHDTSTQHKFELAYSKYDRRILSFSDYIDDYYIFYPKEDIVFNMKRFMDSEGYFGVRYSDTEFSIETWEEEILNNTSASLIALSSSDGKSTVFFAYPTIDITNGEHLYSIVTELNIDRMKADCTLSDEFIIFDDNAGISFNKQKIILSDIMKVFRTDFAQKYLVNEFSNRTELNMCGKEYIINTIDSSVLPIHYATVIPKKEYWQERTYAWLFITIATCMSILAGLAIINYAVKNYKKPLRKILTLFSPTGKTDQPDNPYSYIFDSVSDMLKKNSFYASKLEEQAQKLRQNILIDILNNNVTADESYGSLLDLAGINWQKNSFAVITMIPNISENILLNDSESNSYSISGKAAADFITSRVCYEIMLNWYTPEFFNMKNIIVCILNIDENDAKNLNKNLKCILSEAYDIISKAYNFTFTASVSSVKTGIKQIMEAYSESVFGLEYASSKSSNDNIVFCSDIPQRNIQVGLYTPDIEQQLINCLEIRNYEKCRQLIEKFFFKIELSSYSAESTLLLVCDVISTLYNNKLPENYHKQAKGILKQGLLKIMEKHCSKADIIQNGKSSINEYMSYIEQSEPNIDNGADSKIKSNSNEDIKVYIETNYDKQDLCVNYLGEIFSMNPSYLSKRFKEQYGTVPSDYITKCRIDAAKKLLTSTDKTNSEIAELCGYSNTRTFLRAFSGTQGVTPQQYRNKLSNLGDDV